MGATLTPATVPTASPAAAPAPGLPNTASTVFNRPNTPPPIGAQPAQAVAPTSVAGIQQPDLITSPVAGEAPDLGSSPIKLAFILSVFYKHGFSVRSLMPRNREVDTPEPEGRMAIPDGVIPGAAAGAGAGAGLHALNAAREMVIPPVPAVRSPENLMRMIDEAVLNKQRLQDSPIRNLVAVLKNRGLLRSVAGAARTIAPAAAGGAVAGALIQRARKNNPA